MNKGKKYDLTNPYEIARYIKEAKKTTPVRAYIDGDLKGIKDDKIEIFGDNSFYILFGEHGDIDEFIKNNKDKIKKFKVDFDRRNSAIPMLDIRNVDARMSLEQ